MSDAAPNDQVRGTWPNGVVMASGLQGPRGPDGEWSWFDDSGAIRWRATFVDGELEGLAEHWVSRRQSAESRALHCQSSRGTLARVVRGGSSYVRGHLRRRPYGRRMDVV